MDLPAAQFNSEDSEEEEEDECEENEAQSSCDVCERHFVTAAQYQKHLTEHRTCNIDGCTFTAHGKIVDKHIEMQHSTGLYDKIRNISTPEDIARWIEERKRKYPSKENVEKRLQQQEEMSKRGERLQGNKRIFPSKKRDLRFTHGRGQHARQEKKTKKPSKLKNISTAISLLNDRLDWNGTLCPFRGTAELYGDKIEESTSDFDDNEWLDDPVEKTTETLKLNNNNALSDLISAYNSDDDDIVETVLLESTQNENKNVLNKDDEEAPLELKISRESVQYATAQGSVLDHQQQNVNGKRKRKKGKHSNKTDVQSKQSKMEIAKKTCFVEQPFKKRRVTLLERLLDSEIKHERNVLLQCVRFVVEHSYFKECV